MRTQLTGEILVASRIVDYLSSGLYESPAACLKELVNNAYDADATLVELFVKPDANRIIVSDNGTGMDSADFTRNFSKISESFKRESSDKTESDRPKIGKIGIGFIAANEICDIMQIISTKKGSREKIDVEINFQAMRMPVDERRRQKDSFAKADYKGSVSDADPSEHYTHIFLKNVRGPAQELLSGSRNRGESESLYGLPAAAIAKRLLDPGLRSWEDFDFYSRTMLEVALNVPVAYADDWATSKHAAELVTFTRQAKSLNFRVVFDGTELRKPTIFSPSDKSFVKTFEYKGKDVSFKSYFFVQHGVLKPQDINGILIRIRNSAIGKYERGFLGFPNSIGTLFQRWLSAEVWTDDRLEPAMNIDRKTLRVTHPAYLELVDAFHAQLKQVLAETRERLYEQPSRENKKQRHKQELQTVKAVSDAARNSISSTTAKEMTSEASHKSLLKKYSAVELIEIVLAVAKRTLPAKERKAFMDELVREVLNK